MQLCHRSRKAATVCTTQAIFLRILIAAPVTSTVKKSTARTSQHAQLSQRDRAAGCAIVLAKSGRLELWDNILRTYLQPLWYNRPENLSNSVKKAKWGLLRRPRSIKVTEVGTNRKPVCDFLLVINSNRHPMSYRFGDRSLLFEFWTLFFSSHPLGGGLSTTYDVHLGLIGKRVVDFLLG